MKKFLKNKDNAAILLVSFIAFVAGCLSIGWLIALIIIGIADIAFFLPDYLKRRRRRN